MVIANPIYDVVFKRLMENEKVAKFFIGTLLGEKVETITVKPQEFTHTVKSEDVLVTLSVFRLDFIATIKTETGVYKKILIEIQKARNEIDLMRFRNYLAEQYKKKDKVDDEKVVLPITTIYILGFNLRNINSACIKVERNYKDLVNNTIIKKKSDFVEKLTHDSYVVQVKKITGRYQSRLDKLLSVFEQSNFVDDTEIIKEYIHNADIEEVKIITDILHYTGTDPKRKKEIENEKEAWRTITAMMASKEKEYQKALEKSQNALEKNKKKLVKSEKKLEDNEKKLEDNQKELEDNQKELEEKDRIIAELKRQLKGDKD